ncbi:MAG: ComF family protein [Gammaproteobacteria bacterium]|nr:ComF family protein [Gammaproteobacteria bacterium]
MNRWIQNIQSGLAVAVLPPVCVLCGEAGVRAPGGSSDLCLACRTALPWAENPCARCALPLPATAVEALCGRCQTQPPAFHACLAPFRYGSPLDHLLQGLKFNGRLAQARLLGELMADWLGAVVEAPPDQLIPVPLHAARLRERGFNQALELARPIARQFGLPLNIHGVRRRRATPPQSDLSRQQRLKNIRGAFEVVQPLGAHVVIIDDVMTTGSTADELARTLLGAGAERVEVWVCARA